jgi:phage baseplate assembly protein W
MSTTSVELGNISREFKDISFEFSKNLITDDVVVLKNEEAIKQAVKNLVLTKLGERLFNPYIGTNTTSYLFELSTTFAEGALISEIEKVLKTYEKRISLKNITVNSEDDSNEYNVSIEYFIVGLPQIPQTVTFLLVRES